MILITIATLFNTIVTVSLMAEGLPNGETMVSGVISISQNEQSMTIDQSSNQAIIEWNSFDIGQNNSVTFQQPSISSSALNRVMSGNPTTLAGTLNANGNVYIVNENGDVEGLYSLNHVSFENTWIVKPIELTSPLKPQIKLQ